MTGLKFFKPGKCSGLILTTKDVYKSEMNRALINKDKFKMDKTPDNNQLTECSISRKLQILFLQNYVSEARYRRLRPMETKTPYTRDHQKFINLVYR